MEDITVITPVFQDGEIVFITASRAHHADIGGILPGSMPPTSKELHQEGACIESMKIVDGGEFQLEKLIQELSVNPAKYPGCSGTRNLK